jgi:hypothetical protein
MAKNIFDDKPKTKKNYKKKPMVTDFPVLVPQSATFSSKALPFIIIGQTCIINITVTSAGHCTCFYFIPFGQHAGTLQLGAKVTDVRL